MTSHRPLPHGFGRRALLTCAVALAVAGCSIPAKLNRPPVRDDVPLAGLDTGHRTGWPDTAWWKQYNDPQLDQLIDLAMQGSPDIAQARSRVDSAQQSIRAATAQSGLSVNGNAQVERQRLSETGLIPPKFLGFTWYNQGDIGVQAQYDFDFWGKKRNTIEGAVDQAHAAEAQHSAAALAIQTTVADTYFGWLADQSRITIAKQTVQTAEQLEQIATLRVKQGVDRPDTLQSAKAQTASARQMLVTIESSARIRQAALASLCGVSPAQLPALQPRALPTVTTGLPDNVGVDLIARRPDIAASLWQVEAALRQTDVARAQFYPDISISAMAGLSSIDLDKMFNAGSRVFSLAPALHLPIFTGGLLEANYGISKAQLDAAVAQYNSTVLSAARDVATQSLTADQIEGRRKEQAREIAANQQLLATAQSRVQRGVSDRRETLSAQAQLLQQQDSDVSLQAQALSTDISLIKALGGGYRASLPEQASSDHPTSPLNLSGDAPNERH
jgi:NodT family efflux transporter outer membrane factor (OMF) lipoprotein